MIQLVTRLSILPRIKLIPLLLLILGATFHPAAPLLPPTGGILGEDNPGAQTELPGLVDFSLLIHSGEADQVVGLYAASLMAFPVVSQPANQPSYVSTSEDVLTQFASAGSHGSLGFLAHNNLAGSVFPDLVEGDILYVIYGDAHTVPYEVSQIRRFQATDPGSPYSSFIDQADSTLLSAADLFHQTYGIPGQLILQTCIAAYGNQSWGRLFVIASPVEAADLDQAAAELHPYWLRLR